MMRKRWYGLIGLLSLLGFVGVFTPERYFLGFFAFAVDFQYFFLRPDEMQEGQILRSAALGFFSGMGVTALAVLAALAQLLVHPPGVEARRAMITNRIKEHRARLNLKQEELAKLVGVRRETIGNLEKGKYNPSLVLAWNIAQVFGVPIEEVFTVTPD